MLKGKNISLRPLKISDESLFFKWLNDPKILQFIGFHLPVTEMQEKKWINDQSNKENSPEIMFVIELAKKQKPIGFCCLNNIRYKDRNAGFMVVIGENKFWNKNLGQESSQLLMAYAFKQLNLHRLHTGVYAFNERSIKMLTKLGFEKEGRQKQAVFKNGTYHDIILFGMINT